MSRSLHVYPKPTLVGSSWDYVLFVREFDPATGERIGARSKFRHTIPVALPGLTAEIPLRLLKLTFDLTVADTDTDADVDDAHLIDTASGGPTNGETMWETWQTLAESIIDGLSPGYTVRDFWAQWSAQNTARVRTAARRILINGRGWSVSDVHQHEGDGTVTEE